MELIERNDGRGMRPKSNVEYGELIVQFVAESECFINGYDCRELRTSPSGSCEDCLGYSRHNGCRCGISEMIIMAKAMNQKMKEYRANKGRFLYD